MIPHTSSVTHTQVPSEWVNLLFIFVMLKNKIEKLQNFAQNGQD